jgi:hypothetical protein
MTSGFYVTVLRGSRVGYLAGPFAEHAAALDAVGSARREAVAIDPFCDFDAFGTTKVSGRAPLPPGVLNHLLPEIAP